MKNALNKLLFWPVFGWFLWHFCSRPVEPPTPGFVLWMIVIAAVLALFYIGSISRIVISLINYDKQQRYERDLGVARDAQPVYRLEADQTGALQPKRRPLYDEQMGTEP